MYDVSSVMKSKHSDNLYFLSHANKPENTYSNSLSKPNLWILSFQAESKLKSIKNETFPASESTLL